MNLKIPIHKNTYISMNNKNVSCVNIKRDGFCKLGANCPFKHSVRQMSTNVYLDYIVSQNAEHTTLLNRIASHLEKQTHAINQCADALKQLVVNRSVNRAHSDSTSNEELKHGMED